MIDAERFQIDLAQVTQARLRSVTTRRPLPAGQWQGFKVHYRYREVFYHIAVVQIHAGVEGGKAG